VARTEDGSTQLDAAAMSDFFKPAIFDELARAPGAQTGADLAVGLCGAGECGQLEN
jgi:hypothetical protein